MKSSINKSLKLPSGTRFFYPSKTILADLIPFINFTKKIFLYDYLEPEISSIVTSNHSDINFDEEFKNANSKPAHDINELELATSIAAAIYRAIPIDEVDKSDNIIGDNPYDLINIKTQNIKDPFNLYNMQFLLKFDLDILKSYIKPDSLITYVGADHLGINLKLDSLLNQQLAIALKYVRQNVAKNFLEYSAICKDIYYSDSALAFLTPEILLLIFSYCGLPQNIIKNEIKKNELEAIKNISEGVGYIVTRNEHASDQFTIKKIMCYSSFLECTEVFLNEPQIFLSNLFYYDMNGNLMITDSYETMFFTPLNLLKSDQGNFFNISNFENKLNYECDFEDFLYLPLGNLNARSPYRFNADIFDFDI